MLASKVFKLEYPFFTVIAAIFSMENSIASSYKAGVYRLIGTVVGAFVGVAFIFTKPGDALLMGIGTLVLIFICNTFKWDRAVPIAGVMFAAIMLSLNNKDPFRYSLSRILDTFAGVAIAVMVNYLIFPVNNLSQLSKSLDAVSAKLYTAVIDFVCLGKNVDLNSLRIEIIDSIKFLEAYKIEFNPKIDGNLELTRIDEKLESLRSVLSHLKTVDELRSQCSLSHDNAEKLKHLNLCDINTKEFPNSSENLVYNYHVGKILDILPGLASELH